jgi:hypothetical protein
VNCLDFRRRWLTVPGARDLVAIQHERACLSCRQFARRSSVFEHKLREALTVEVPAGLIERIKQRRDIGEQVRARQIRPLRYALAASLLLAAGLASLLGYQLLGPAFNDATLQRTVTQHINHDIEDLYAHDEVSVARLRPLFARFGVRLQRDLGRVNFAASWSRRQHRGLHVVLAGKRGPVTILYLDGEYVEHSSRIHNERFEGTLFPVESGSVAVVGERGESIEAIARKLRDKLRFGA